MKNGQQFSKPIDRSWLHNNQYRFSLFFVAAFLIVGIASTLLYSKKFLPYPASTPATQVVPLFTTTAIVSGVIFLVTQVLLFYFLFRNRTVPRRSAAFVTGSFNLEVTWSVLTTLFFIFLFFWSERLWTKITSVPDDALAIEVVGQQFNWHVRYAGRDHKLGRASFRFVSDNNDCGIDPSDPSGNDDFIPVQMHVPKNRLVHLMLRSNDVIHSFYIPFFRSKMDAVPGMVTSMTFTPILSTEEARYKYNDPTFNYEIGCAELCGRMHFVMKLILVVDEPADYEVWVHKQKPFRNQNISE